MADTRVAPTNKAVAFRGRPQKEYARAYKRGLISDAALRKATKKSKFARKASHNPPKPTHTTPHEAAPASALETIARPVAGAARRLQQYLHSDKPTTTPTTMGIRG